MSFLSQLTFDWPIKPSTAVEDFVVTEANEEAYYFIHSWPHWPAYALHLTGPEGSGKTHLAKLWQQKSGAYDIANGTELEAAYHAPQGSCFVLELDAQNFFSEHALFHLVNRAMLSEIYLLITQTVPAQRQFVTADLRSRLSSFPHAVLKAPDDVLLAALLVKQFSDRQIEIDADVVQFILPRIERSTAAVKQTVNLLDKFALSEGHKLNKIQVSRYLRNLDERKDLATQSVLQLSA